jgi:cobalt-zinc-cadmium resistance protein CzcA
MLNKIISFSVRNKLIIGLFVIALTLWGAFEVTRLPIDAVPDITDNQVQVLTVSPSLGAPDVERLITFPIEQSCSNIPGLKQIRSFSRFGLSLVTIVFTDETELYWARQQVAERLQQVQRDIPEGIGAPELAPVSTGLGEIYQYVIRPKKGYEQQYDAMELRTLQDWVVRRQLMGTPGVAEVSSFGGRLKQYEIAVRPEQLKAHNISIDDVFIALEKNNQNTGGAYIEKGPTVLYIRSEGLTTSLEDIGKIVVKTVGNGMPLLIRDVAEVRYGSAIRYGAMTYNDQGEVAGAVVMMLKGENSSQVVARVKEKISEIQKSLPDGVVIEPFLDRTKMVNNAIKTVEQNLIEGALIVVLVLVFFLGNLRAGLIVSSVIPLSMLFAIILMNQFGVGGNLMSLGAIDFGLIVDGSVIVVEAILHRFAHSKNFRSITRINGEQMDHEVTQATSHTINSAVFSQIIILIVYLPILSLQGIEGKMFKPMAFTIAFAILGAFILSITYVPMMNALLLNKKLQHKKTLADRMMIWLERRYQPILGRVLRFPMTTIVSALMLFGVSVYVLSKMGGEFIPTIEEGDFAVETRLLTGSNLNNTIKFTQQASKILLDSFPEVEKVVTKIGSAEIPTDPMPLEAGDMMVILKDKDKWTSAESFPQLAEQMTEKLGAVPGITVGFQFPVQMRFNELMTGARQDVVCKIFGENLDSLAVYASRLHGIINTVPGAINVYEETVTGMPQIVIKYNRDAMSRYGLSVEEINRVINAAFAGQSAGQVFEGERKFDLVVRVSNEGRKSIADVENMLVPTPNGTQIPVSQVADISEVSGVNQIQRENTRRRIVVGFNVSGRDVQSIVNELQEKAARQLNLPRDYSLVYGGSFENMNAAKARLSVVVPVALLMIFLLLYFAFNSVKQGLLIYTAIPLSAMGGIFALWVRDMPFSISAGVGFIALFGVAVLNGILLVSEFNRLKKEGWHDTRRIVMHATKSKLRALLMTAVVPSLGFVPMAVSTGAGGAVQKPLATVVIGGLIISTLLTLFVLPVLYLLFENGLDYLRPRKKIVMTALLLLAAGTYGVAQQKVKLEECFRLAKEKNLHLQAAVLNENYYSALTKSSVDLPATSFGYEHGQLNSTYTDNRFTINQGIQFPTVYKNQRRVNRTNVNISKTQTALSTLQVQTEIKRLFYALLVMRERRKVLQNADSIYESVVEKAGNRLRLGESDALELATVRNQRSQIAAQLQMLQRDETIFLGQLRNLVNDSALLLPGGDSIRYPISPALLVMDSVPESNPSVQMQDALIEHRKASLQLEKSKLLPSIGVGYANASFSGLQATASGEKYFGRGDRFQSAMFGIELPIFRNAQQARIKASKIQISQQEVQHEAEMKNLNTALLNARKTYAYNHDLITRYHESLLLNADMILSTATNKLRGGDINYLEWALLINQAIETKSQYYLLIDQLNESAIEIENIVGVIY